MSPTFDESTHISAGFSYVKTNDYSLNFEHPPLIKQISAIPLLFMPLGSPEDYIGWKEKKIAPFSHFFLYSGNDFESIFFWSRLMIVLIGILLGIYIFIWSRELWGDKGALFSLFFFALCPNMIANSGLVTTDLGIAAFFFIHFYYFIKFCKQPKAKHTILSGISLGLSLASKFSSIAIFPITACIFLTIFIENLFVKDKGGESVSSRVKSAFRSILSYIPKYILILLIGIIFLWADYGFESKPYPFYSYLKGLKSGLEHSGRGHWAFLFGKVKEGGWWYYFPVTFLIKTPIPTIVLMVLSVYFILIKKCFKDKNYLILIPPVIYFVTSCVSKINIGYRHILPVLPFIFLFIGCLLVETQYIASLRIARNKLIILLLSIWYIWGAATIYPYHLTYFNELIGGPKNGYKYLGDSNLDWGQGLKELKRFMDKKGLRIVYFSCFGYTNPVYYDINYVRLPGFNDLLTPIFEFDRNNPQKGIYAISVTNLQGIYLRDFDTFKYFRERKPTARVGNCIYVYVVRGEEK